MNYWKSTADIDMASFSFRACRFYFKKVSDEFDCGVVFEEVREEDAILPIFEEKIIGKVEKIDWQRGGARSLGNRERRMQMWVQEEVTRMTADFDSKILRDDG